MNGKNSGDWRLRFVELYMTFLEVEESLEKLNKLLSCEDDEKNNLTGDVEYSLDTAMAHFIMDYNRQPRFEPPEHIKEKLQMVGKKVQKELEEAEKMFPSSKEDE